MGKKVIVVVLGDMGHSPRMMNHSLSLAENGFEVSFIGYVQSNLPPKLKLNKKIDILPMWSPPNLFFIPRILYFFFKVFWQSFFLFWALPWFSGPEFLLLQNPPCIPALPVLYIYTLIHWNTRLILDWHNYGYTILALSLGEGHPLVFLAKWIEKKFGRRAYASFCVSRAMKCDLALNFGVYAQVLYDRPGEAFVKIPISEQHKLFLKMGPEFSDKSFGTVFTEEFARGRAHLKDDRPGLLVSSTSWTPDEDFGLLFKALQVFEEIVKSSPSSFPPYLMVIVTGKGPLKKKYTNLIENQNWNYVKVFTPWLESEDYPKLLASADLGVCLHSSSSGLDLPMKVVDMFGVGLPVVALRYPALPELVRDGENGLIFESSEELADIIVDWFKGFPFKTIEKFKPLSDNLEEYQCLRWPDYWIHTALPIFEL